MAENAWQWQERLAQEAGCGDRLCWGGWHTWVDANGPRPEVDIRIEHRGKVLTDFPGEAALIQWLRETHAGRASTVEGDPKP